MPTKSKISPEGKTLPIIILQEPQFGSSNTRDGRQAFGTNQYSPRRMAPNLTKDPTNGGS